MPGKAMAHASEQGFVLLLPTQAYIMAGTATVALTVLLLAILPGRVQLAVFSPVNLVRIPRLPFLRAVASTLAFALLVFLVWAGLEGPRDPLANPLPLFVWTVWWVGFVTVQGVFGDLWRWVNPWSGPVAITRTALGVRPVWRYPRALGHLPAIGTFLGFAAVLMADPAPADPARLAVIVSVYWAVTFFAALAFGPRWMVRGEGLTALMRSYARLGLFGRRGRKVAVGLTGWKILAGPVPPTGLAVFALIVLGCGSFDGLNETFWWLARIGVNPLEFPGRSAVVAQNVIGLLAMNVALVACFALSVRLGLWLAGDAMPFRLGFRLFALSVLPIALGYHVAHYLTSFLVDGQYALAAATDPLAVGADYLGLGTFYVTTGFFNTQDSVRVIWLSQAGAVVAGHVLAVMLAHALALRAFGSNRRAALSQAPLAVFMIGYTLFGLWLLASPRGL